MKIKDILNQSKPCWKYAAIDEDRAICFYTAKPRICDGFWGCSDENDDFINITDLDEVFDIEPFEGDWKDSLIEREE